MQELQFIPERLEAIQQELGVFAFSGFLEDARNKARHIVESDLLSTDVYYHSAASDAIRENIKALVEDPSAVLSYKYFFYSEKASKPIRVYRDLFSSIAIVYYDSCLHQEAELRKNLVLDIDQYSLVLVIPFVENESVLHEFQKTIPNTLKIICLSPEQAHQRTLPELMELASIQPTTRNSLKRISRCKSLNPLFVFLQEIFESENRTIQSRKLLNGQFVQITRKEEQGFNINDLSTNLRQLLQRQTQDLDKTFRAKYEELNKPNTGLFSKIGQQESLHLKDFNKLDIAEKTEKVGVSIDKTITDRFLERIKQSITGEIAKDEPYLTAALADLIEKVNYQLSQKGIAPVSIAAVAAPFPLRQKLIESYAYVSRVYAGELTKKGTTEYFIALRDYIGIMMVATGLLAPLNLIASLSDEHSMLKKLSTGIKIATALLTIALIIYGIFDLRRRIPRKRAEEFERELNKAREFLLQESRRIFNDSSRDWAANLSSWIRDTMQNLTGQIDQRIKDMQTARLTKLNEEKAHQLRMQQSIDIIQRNLQSAEKVKDAMISRFKDLLLETQKELKF